MVDPHFLLSILSHSKTDLNTYSYKIVGHKF